MHSEKISVPITDELFSEIKHLSENGQSRFFYQLVQHYIEKKKKEYIRADLKQGYIEMAEINRSIAESFAHAEWEAFHTSELRKHIIHYGQGGEWMR
ncbi:CopG family transcriptional regulator/antitoxin EndoAI [Geomicrobium halophilum]|uniref:CopG family transcriptional regulator/antitoxin EndoAI n=1 Tax=Geomicrobium halophilum TaxID=549000 RepID=A0A841PY04_9BACL|nr:antitoxin endoai [Geomicrobium halophilum]MBB6449112.1 CopG family transcriptional regulator/antitoxin EndoAI [Geomicrobium halophilum]